MSIKSLLTLRNLFGELDEQKERTLFSETLFMVLAGAANADLNIEAVETARIAGILKEKLGTEVSHTDIKTTAELDLSNTATVAKNVSRACQHLSVSRRQELLDSMLEVFKSDGSIGPLEQDYFNRITESLDLTPSQMMKL